MSCKFFGLFFSVSLNFWNLLGIVYKTLKYFKNVSNQVLELRAKVLEINAGLKDFYLPEIFPLLALKPATRFQFSYHHYIRHIFIFPQKKKLTQKIICFSDKTTKSCLKVMKTERLLALYCAIPSNISSFPCIKHHKNVGKDTVMRGKSEKEVFPLLMHTKDS